MENILQDLVDEHSIKKLQLKYCRGIDQRDWKLVRSCYHPDAVDDHGEFTGGVEEFLEYCKNGVERFVSTTHFLCNQLVDVEGDTAHAEAYVLAFHRIPADTSGAEKDWICNARFVDRLERRQGEWRIANRRVITDSDRVVPVGESWLELFDSGNLLQETER